MKKLTALLLGGIIFLVGVVLATAGDVREKDVEKVYAVPVLLGVYHDFNFKRKLKLGTAPYVNPGLLKTTSVVFKYKAKRIKVEDMSIVKALVLKGHVAAMTHDNGSWNFVDQVKAIRAIEAYGTHKKMGVKEALMKDWEHLNFVGYNPKFLGFEPDGALVSWNATKAVYKPD